MGLPELQEARKEMERKRQAMVQMVSKCTTTISRTLVYDCHGNVVMQCESDQGRFYSPIPTASRPDMDFCKGLIARDVLDSILLMQEMQPR